MEHPMGAPVVDAYNTVAKRTIGRWAGDRIAIIGDYSEDSDMPDSPVPFGSIYSLCSEGLWVDVTADVARVIEHEVGGKFVGDGWKTFKRDE